MYLQKYAFIILSSELIHPKMNSKTCSFNFIFYFKNKHSENNGFVYNVIKIASVIFEQFYCLVFYRYKQKSWTLDSGFELCRNSLGISGNCNFKHLLKLEIYIPWKCEPKKQLVSSLLKEILFSSIVNLLCFI